MAKKIIGNVASTGNITSYSKNTIRDINGIEADDNGNIDYPYYTKENIDKIISMLPVSRVGSLDYLPMNISGSFNGATTLYNNFIFPCIMESDGTMVYLRPGTNGNDTNFYYCYISDVRTSSDMNPILTNTPYVPTFFTNTHRIKTFINTNAKDLLLMSTSNNGNNTYTIALTNGTLNPSSHIFLEFDASLIPSTDIQYCHIVNNIIYFWCIDSYNASDKFSISLYTMLTSDVVNGKTTSLKKITGFNGSTINNNNISNSDSIVIASKYISSNASDDTFSLQGSGTSITLFQLNKSGVIQSSASDDNTKIRVALFHPYVVNVNFQSATQYCWGVSLVLNLSDLSYNIDNKNGYMSTTIVDNKLVINNPYELNMENINGIQSNVQGNVPSIYQTDDGIILSSVARYITSPTHLVSKCLISNYSSKFDSLNLNTRQTTNKIRKSVNPQYGSSVGENLLNPIIISPTKMIISCSGTNDNGNYFDFNNKVIVDIGSDINYNYNSVISQTTLRGFAPQKYRKLIPNTGNRLMGMISITDNTSGNISAYGSSFIEGIDKSGNNGKFNVDTELFDGLYTLQNSNMLTTLKNTMIDSVTYDGDIIDSKVIFYYIPDNSISANSYALVSFFTNSTDKAGYCILSEVGVTVTNNVITGLSPINYTINKILSGVITLNTANSIRMSGLVISKYSDFTYFGASTFFNLGTPGNAIYNCAISKIDNSTKKIASNISYFRSQYVSGAGGSYGLGTIPNLGFGVFENGDVTDYQTKLVFKNFGTTASDFDKMITNIGGTPIERLVVVSQDVAQGYIVYFTQEIPVLLNGKFFNMPAGNIDLTSIITDPSNRTFNVYISVSENIAKYIITTDKLSEELYRVYIGNIQTNDSSISSINISKVSRFLTYRTNINKFGSSIPVSTGVPATSGTRWH